MEMNLKIAEEYVENIAYQSNMLLTLINDLMDLAKLETLNFKLNEDYFSLPELIRQAFKTVRCQANKKKINLIHEFSTDELGGIDTSLDKLGLTKSSIQEILSQVLGDKCRYMQILLNFLSNAIKFTTSGKTIYVRVKL